MTRFFKYPLALLLVAALQTGAIAYMVYDHNTALNAQARITLPTIPVDPRDLFRGDYVILRYPISRIAKSDVELKGFNNGRGYRNQQVFVSLKKAADGTWTPSRLAANTQPKAPGEIVLAGKIKRTFKAESKTIEIDYGLNRFFVPEGKGKAIERAIRDKKVAVEVAVSKKGRGTIRKLLIDGKPAYTVSLFD